MDESTLASVVQDNVTQKVDNFGSSSATYLQVQLDLKMKLVID